jgi:hypothetical protein
MSRTINDRRHRPLLRRGADGNDIKSAIAQK